MRKSLFVFGYGFSGEAIVNECRSEFESIAGTTRSRDKAAKMTSMAMEGLVFDGKRLDDKTLQHLKETTHLVISVAPKETDPVLDALGDDLKKQCPKLTWVGYLSTVGVYGNHDGAWVTEQTAPKPVSERSIWRVNAENQWGSATERAQIPLAIFRLSGIYGPGRNAFINIQKGRARRLIKPGQVFNRVHRDDIGQAVARAVQQNTGGVFNITDNEPAPPQDVVTLAHELMGIDPPREQDFETAELSPMARSFYGENKRVANQKSKEQLGMEYRWPDYRTSLKRMHKEGSWKPV